MKMLLRVLAVVCLAISCAQAQNLTTVTASSLYKGGVLLSSGQICFTGTDSNDNPIPFRVGGGGQEVTFPYCAVVTNGAIVGTFQVANPANTAPANISYRVELFDQYNRLQKWPNVQFTGATFNFDNYVPSANLPLGTSANVVTIGNLTVTGSCTGCGSGGGGYSTIENAGSALAQRATANFFSGITCADNSGQSRTDCQVDQTFSPTWTGTHTFNSASTLNIAGTFQINGGAPQGKIPIGNGTTYVPGDPLVQGTQAAGSTTATNPVSVGGYDTLGTPVLRTETVLNGAPAGTEYGFVTRNIPSGTQTVSVSNTPAVTSSQLPSSLDGSGYLKVHEQGTATVSGTVMANIGTTNGLALDATVSNPQFSAGTTTAPGKVTLVGGKTSDSTPQYQPLPLTNGGAAVKVDGSAVTQPISGTVTANAGTGTFNIQSNASINVSQIGGTAVVADPCQASTKSYVSINQTANAQLVTGTASKKIYPCSLNLVTATAQNIAVVEGTGTTCGTSTAGVNGFGGSTAATGWNFAANSGVAYGNGSSAIGQEQTAADNLCLFQSGTGQVSGGLSYVVQ